MHDSFELTHELHGPAVVLRIVGRLDARSAPQLLHACARRAAPGVHLVLNLAQVTFLSSSGVGALLTLSEDYQGPEGSFRLASVSPEVRSAIRLLNLEPFLLIHETEAEALEHAFVGGLEAAAGGFEGAQDGRGSVAAGDQAGIDAAARKRLDLPRGVADEKQVVGVGLRREVDRDRAAVQPARLDSVKQAREHLGHPPVAGDGLGAVLGADTRAHTAIAGIDEAGRGPLAGPVVAAAVIFPPGIAIDGIDGIDDSKALDEETRNRLDVEIRAKASAFAIGLVEVEEIDRLNIYHATVLAMRRAVVRAGAHGAVTGDGRGETPRALAGAI